MTRQPWLPAGKSPRVNVRHFIEDKKFEIRWGQWGNEPRRPARLLPGTDSLVHLNSRHFETGHRGLPLNNSRIALPMVRRKASDKERIQSLGPLRAEVYIFSYVGDVNLLGITSKVTMKEH